MTKRLYGMNFLSCACAAMLLGFSGSASAQESLVDPALEADLDAQEAEIIGDADVVTLDIDAALWEDDEMMVALLSATPDDGEVPRNIRKIVAGVVSEMQIALNNRIQGDMLMLDDGKLADLKAGKKKAAKKKKAHKSGATVFWTAGDKGQPAAIMIRTETRVRILCFPPGSAQGAPHFNIKCAF